MAVVSNTLELGRFTLKQRFPCRRQRRRHPGRGAGIYSGGLAINAQRLLNKYSSIESASNISLSIGSYEVVGCIALHRYIYTMQYMKAKLIYNKHETRADGVRLELVIWQLPAHTADRPHGFKYRLYAGLEGKTLVRYDNETGKGDHKHVGESETEIPYHFVSLGQLVNDFIADAEKLK